MKRKVVLGLAVIIGLLITAALVTASLWPVMNVVETGKTPAYPEAMPMYYSTDLARVFDESKATVETLEEWTVTGADVEKKTITAERETKLFGFIDDIEIRVEVETEFVTRVHVRSASRVGKGDFGQNARNIEQFYTELNRRLGAVRFQPGES